MIILIDIEKAFNKTQSLFLIKSLGKGVEWDFLSLIWAFMKNLQLKS